MPVGFSLREKNKYAAITCTSEECADLFTSFPNTSGGTECLLVNLSPERRRVIVKIIVMLPFVVTVMLVECFTE